MIKAIVVLLIVVNGIRLVADSVDYTVPSLVNLLPPEPPTIDTNIGVVNAVANALLIGIMIVAFLLDMVLALFVVPVWLLSLPDVATEIKLGVITPIVSGYGFIGYRLIRRG